MKETIDEVGERVTLVVVAHRLSTLESCDRVIAVDNGRIVADADLPTALSVLDELGTRFDDEPEPGVGIA